MKKLVSIAVVLSLLVAAIVPATVAAWDPGAGDQTLYARTPLGDLVGKVMKLSFTLFAKWVDQGVGNVTIQTYDPITGWSEDVVSAVAIGPLSTHGAAFIAAMADIITWGTDILADIVGMMAGAGFNATFPP